MRTRKEPNAENEEGEDEGAESASSLSIFGAMPSDHG